MNSQKHELISLIMKFIIVVLKNQNPKSSITLSNFSASSGFFALI